MTRTESNSTDGPRSVDQGAASLRLRIEGGAEPRTVEYDSLRELIVGRDANALIRLPHDAVSRQHLRLFHREGRWFAEDLGSRHGTTIDGVMLAPRRPIPVGHSATIVIRPFALRLEAGAISESTRGLRPHLAELSDSELVRPLAEEELGSINGRRLALLLQAAEAINSARDERGVAEAATEVLLTGTGFARALAIRWTGDIETVETVAVRVSADSEAVPSTRVSRTMLKAASDGSPVRLEDVAAIRDAESIIGSGVAAALCAPIVVPPVVEGFLYLDSQRRSARPNPDAAAFCQLVAKLCGLAIGSLRRVAAEQRQRDLEQQLGAARRAQGSLLPAERGERSGCRWRLFMRPGLLVAGDIAGVHEGADGVTFFVGDVRGKGVEAAIVMTMVASHLSACLSEGRALADAITRTGAFLHEHRRDEADFVSLFAVQVDRRAGVLRTVDAGHGLALEVRGDIVETLHSGGGTVLGIAPDIEYEASEVPMKPNTRILLITDGVVEQHAGDGRGMFGLDAVSACVAGAASPEHLVDRVCAALKGHAGSDEFADDVTILCVDAE